MHGCEACGERLLAHRDLNCLRRGSLKLQLIAIASILSVRQILRSQPCPHNPTPFFR